MAAQLTPQQRADAAATELRTLIRQAHEAAQMLADTTRSARAQVDDYLGDGVQSALDAYTGQIQAALDNGLSILRTTSQAALNRLTEQLQAVADAHSAVLIGMAELLNLSHTYPDEGYEARKAAIMRCGKRLEHFYTQAGLIMRDTAWMDELNADRT